MSKNPYKPVKVPIIKLKSITISKNLYEPAKLIKIKETINGQNSKNNYTDLSSS